MYPFFGSIVNRVLHRKRTCPKCKREQISPGDPKKPARCKFCGAEIPPLKPR